MILAIMSNDWEFTEDEIKDKLAELGYNHIPREKLKEFATDLKQLIQFESSSQNSNSISTGNTDSYTSATTDTETPDERPCAVSRRYAEKNAKRGLSHIPYGKENNLYTIREIETPSSDSASLDYTRSGQRMTRKRKVLRRKNGEARVFDESFTSTDSGSVGTDISDIEQQLRELPLHDLRYGLDDDDSVLQEPLGYRPWEGKHASGALPSYIRPSTSHPHTRKLKKCDPVNRYRQFSREWETTKRQVKRVETHFDGMSGVNYCSVMCL
ncbi:hypothetical protein QZH41_015690, partial [Actinostola sp. cb2023]